MLREDGGFEYKKIVVSTMLSLMSAVEEAKDVGMWLSWGRKFLFDQSSIFICNLFHFRLYSLSISGLDNLCEFIEDCEFSELSVQVLHVLAQEAPRYE